MIPISPNASSMRTSLENPAVRLLLILPHRYRIIAAFVKWMTTAKPFQTQPYPFRCSMKQDRVAHINGAGGMKAAGGGQQGRYQAFVEVEAAGDEAGGNRWNRRLTSARSSGNGQSKLLRRGLKTIDHSGLRNSSFKRTASRRRRRMRLRTTALPRARGVVKPTLWPVSPGSCRRQ